MRSRHYRDLLRVQTEALLSAGFEDGCGDKGLGTRSQIYRRVDVARCKKQRAAAIDCASGNMVERLHHITARYFYIKPGPVRQYSLLAPRRPDSRDTARPCRIQM